MSPAEAKAALLLIDRPRARPRVARGPLYIGFLLLSEVGGVEYRVALEFDTARDTLQQVRFVPKEPAAARAAFDSLKALLAEKYGAPTESRSNSEDSQQLNWAFPSTVIRLRWARQLSAGGAERTALAYSSRRLFERPPPGESPRRLDDLDKL
jgi:hypothetical protein